MNPRHVDRIAQARRAFEEWAAGRGYGNFKRRGAGYADLAVQVAWREWLVKRLAGAR